MRLRPLDLLYAVRTLREGVAGERAHRGPAAAGPEPVLGWSALYRQARPDPVSARFWRCDPVHPVRGTGETRSRQHPGADAPATGFFIPNAAVDRWRVYLVRQVRRGGARLGSADRSDGTATRFSYYR